MITLLGVGLEWNIKHRAEVGLAAHQVDALPAMDTTVSSQDALATALVSGSTPVTTGDSGPVATTATTATTDLQAQNILLLGSDTRAGGNASVGTSASTDGVANSDVVMVAHISVSKHVSVLSIPRDTMIPAPTTCRVWNAMTQKVSDQMYVPDAGQRFHFNAGYSVGGPKCTVTEVQNLTGLHIDRFIGIDFDGFQAMVDALGGISVDICAPITDRVLGVVVRSAGVQKIDGTQALNLVRARDVIGDSLSDLARIRRQQIVLSTILRQVTQAGTLLNPEKLDGFLQAFVKNTVTDNVTFDDLVALAGSLGNLSPGVVTFYTLPTTPSTITPGALEVKTAAAEKLFAKIKDDGVSTSTTSKVPTTSQSASSTAATSTATAASPSSTVESVNAGAAECAGPGNE